MKSYKVLLRFVVALVCTLSCLPAAQASTLTSGKISGIVVQPGGIVFFNTDGTRTAVPGCHAAGTRWVFNATAPSGSAMLAVLLSLQAQGKSINIAGTGSCSDWPDTESVYYIQQAT